MYHFNINFLFSVGAMCMVLSGTDSPVCKAVLCSFFFFFWCDILFPPRKEMKGGTPTQTHSHVCAALRFSVVGLKFPVRSPVAASP